MFHILIFVFSFLCLVGPRQTFVSVDCQVDTANTDQNAPPNGLKKLQESQDYFSYLSKLSILTIPAMMRPPTVPCDPIEAAAILEISEICSSVANSVPNFGIMVIGEFKSVFGVIA